MATDPAMAVSEAVSVAATEGPSAASAATVVHILYNDSNQFLIKRTLKL